MAKNRQDIDLCIRNAKKFLNQGDAKSALEELEEFARNDSQNVHFERPEFYRLLWVSQESLGIDSHHDRNKSTSSPLAALSSKIVRSFNNSLRIISRRGIETKGLTWITSLDMGERLLNEGKARESIAYFKFSIEDNPGECGTSAALDRARDRIKAAEALIMQMNATDSALAGKKKK